MTTSLPTVDKIEPHEIKKLDSTNLDWSTMNYGSEKSTFWWRVFIWTLTVIAICGMAATLFWWQVDRGVGPDSTLSTVTIIRGEPVQATTQQDIPNNRTPKVSLAFPQPKSGGRFMVLAGSFIDEQNAKRVFDKLLKAGVPVRAKRAMVSGQRHTHLLIGPYQRENSAELAVSRIRKLTGLPADYTTLYMADEIKSKKEPVAVTVKKSTKSPALHPDQFLVLAGSFLDRDLADRVQKRLQQKNISASIKEVNEQDRTFFHVVVGPYRLATQANAMVDTIRQKTGILAESTQVL